MKGGIYMIACISTRIIDLTIACLGSSHLISMRWRLLTKGLLWAFRERKSFFEFSGYVYKKLACKIISPTPKKKKKNSNGLLSMKTNRNI